jgi:hypothetical protein
MLLWGCQRESNDCSICKEDKDRGWCAYFAAGVYGWEEDDVPYLKPNYYWYDRDSLLKNGISHLEPPRLEPPYLLTATDAWNIHLEMDEDEEDPRDWDLLEESLPDYVGDECTIASNQFTA